MVLRGQTESQQCVTVVGFENTIARGRTHCSSEQRFALEQFDMIL